MLPGGLDPLYRALLAGPHNFFTRVMVMGGPTGDDRIDPFGDDGVPVTAGAVNANLNSRVSRTVTLATTQDMFPADPSGLLAPFGNHLRVVQGVNGYGGPSYEWITFDGRIDTVALFDTGSVELNAIDHGGDISDSFFSTPQQSVVGSLITDQFRFLVRDGFPTATFGTFDPIFATTPNLIWQSDRASACDQLAAAANAYWYPLANSDFVMRIVPWTVASPPLLTLHDDEPDGTLANWSVGYNRNGVNNVITVLGERADGTAPVFATVADTDPTSPTWIGGKFGVRGRQIQLQSVFTQGQAASVAAGYLRQDKALTDNWTATVPADAALELGDAILLRGNGRTSSVQTVVSFSLPLLGSDMMTITTRAQTPGAVLNESV